MHRRSFGRASSVYLLGGSSSVGKTTAAAAVAERLGAVHLQLDSVARASADPRDHRLGAGVDDLWSLPAAHVCDLLVQKGEALAAPVHALIGGACRVSRSPWSRAKASIPALLGATRATWSAGCWLRRQAQQFGQPWVQSRPWATLPDRLIQAWHRPIPHSTPHPSSLAGSSAKEWRWMNR